MYTKLVITALLVGRLAVASLVPSDSDLILDDDPYDDTSIYADKDEPVRYRSMLAEDFYNEPNGYSFLTPRAEHGNQKHHHGEPKSQDKVGSGSNVPKKAGHEHHAAGQDKAGHQSAPGKHKDNHKDQQKLEVGTHKFSPTPHPYTWHPLKHMPPIKTLPKWTGSAKVHDPLKSAPPKTWKHSAYKVGPPTTKPPSTTKSKIPLQSTTFVIGPGLTGTGVPVPPKYKTWKGP